MLLAENLKTPLNASIAFDRSNGLSPYTSRKREQNGFITRNVLSFSVSEVFAAAKVKLLCSEVCATHK